MPPQSRSSTCATCQKRKVKCDRLRPACSQCLKYQWKCPGYGTAPNPQNHGGQGSLATKGRRRDSTATVLPQHPKATLSQRPTRSSTPHPIAPAVNVVFPPSSESSLLAALLVHRLSSGTLASPFKRLGPFMDFVPTRIGINAALDDTIRLICYAGRIPESGSPDESPGSSYSNRCEYYKALKSLRLSLQDEKRALSSEVLCATILLTWYEAHANEKDDCWLTHTGGCSQLIQLRGPQRHVADFDRALLHGQQHLIVSEALIRQKACFLDDPSWRKVLALPVSGSDTYPEMNSNTKSNLMMAALASFRRDVREFRDIEHPDHRRASLGQILLRADRLRGDLKRGLMGRATAIGIPPDYSPVIFVKDALTLIVADATLVGLYDFSTDILEDLLIIELKPAPDSLHVEVAETFKHVYKALDVASEVSPVETNQLLLVVRKLCIDMLSKLGHPKHTHLWKSLEETVNKIDFDKNDKGNRHRENRT